jgi:dihydropteroate synthase
MNRKIHYWKLRSVELQLGEKTLIMGILNVTPDSFSDGGKFSDPDRALARALELEEQGADIIDIGAESTSPGSHRVSAEEEWRRLVPVLKRLRDKLTIPISLDTYKAETAERAFEYGVEIVNDPSGLTFDAELAKTAANANAGLILNHMRGTPETWAKLPPLPDMIGSVARDLEATINRARRAGVDRARIVVDPGLGFGKRREQNAEILAHLRQLAPLDCPILTGPSRKSFLAQPTDAETLYSTAAAVAVSIMNGAHIVRVHDVKEMRAVALIVDEVVRASDAKQAAQAAAQAAERPVPRRTSRLDDDRPRPTVPPILRPVPNVTPKPQDTINASKSAEPVEPGAEVSVPPVDAKPVERQEREATEEARPARKPYADRPPRRDTGSKPPSRDFGNRPLRRDLSDRPPRRDSSDRPPRRDAGDRPPRREFASKTPSGDRPPRREFGDRRAPGSDRPPRREFSGSRPPTGDRPPRREFGAGKPPTGRPPRRDFGASKPPGADRPPRRDFGDKPARSNFGSRPGGDRRPGPDGGSPRGKGPTGGSSKRPPSRPFRKRP